MLYEIYYPKENQTRPIAKRELLHRLGQICDNPMDALKKINNGIPFHWTFAVYRKKEQVKQ